MVREHHDQPGPDVSERGSGSEHGIGAQRAELPPGARPVPPLHTQRPVDRHQHDMRRPHPHPSQETAQRLDQGERRSGTYLCPPPPPALKLYLIFPRRKHASFAALPAARDDAILPNLRGDESIVVVVVVFVVVRVGMIVVVDDLQIRFE